MGEYLETLGGRSASTVDAYGRILRSLAGWVAERLGGAGGFRPELLTRTAVETHLKGLEDAMTTTGACAGTPPPS